MLDGKIIKQIKNMENNYLVTIEQHNQMISELAIQLQVTISSLKMMDEDITKLEELMDNQIQKMQPQAETEMGLGESDRFNEVFGGMDEE